MKKLLLIWFFSMLGIRLIHELGRLPIFRDNTLILTAALLLYVPLIISWKSKEPIPCFEKDFKQVFRSLSWFLIISLAIFPVLEIGNRFFQAWVFGHHYVGGNVQGMFKTALIHLTLIAFPEEFFYRGYLQTQLNKIWGRPYQFLGTNFGKGLIVTSLLFAIAHSLIQLQWWHFAIFFPSLAFGWLREKTGKLTASILFHALSNLYSYWVFLNYR